MKCYVSVPRVRTGMKGPIRQDPLFLQPLQIFSLLSPCFTSKISLSGFSRFVSSNSFFISPSWNKESPQFEYCYDDRNRRTTSSELVRKEVGRSRRKPKGDYSTF